MAKKHLLGAVSTMVGYIIGAGILGIPYVFAKAGFLTGFLTLIILGITAMLINLYTGEIALRTKGSHQLTGYADIYLGKYAKYLMLVAMVFMVYGALTAYILKGGEFISVLLAPILNLSPMICSILFFAAGTSLVFIGIKAIEKSEMLFFIFFMVIILAILFIAYPFIKTGNLASFDIKNIFIPYGIVLFAYMGIAAVPEIREELKHNNIKLMKKAIIIGSLIPIVIYALFAFAVVGVTGTATTDGAIIGLGNVVGPFLLTIGVVFGIITVFTSFLVVSLSLKETYNFDLKLNKKISSELTCFVPLLAALSMIYTGIHNAFFMVLNITGALSFSAMGILLVLIINKAKKHGKRKPEYSIKINNIISSALILLFLSGFIYQILSVLNIW